MKKSEKQNLENKGLKTYMGTALWTVFRCWKTNQWAYNLENKKGVKLWDAVKKGEAFKYSDGQIGVDISKNKETGLFSASMFTNTTFKDGVREEKEKSTPVVAPSISEPIAVVEPAKTEKKGKKVKLYTDNELKELRLHEEGTEKYFWNVVTRRRASENKIPAGALASIPKENFVKKTKKPVNDFDFDV